MVKKKSRPDELKLLNQYIEEKELSSVEQIRGTVLIFVFLFAFLTTPAVLKNVSIIPYISLIFIMIVYYGIIYRRIYNWVWENKKLLNSFKHMQSIINLLLITVLVHLTGGVESYFTFVYIFEIIMAGFLLSWKESFLEASMGWIFYLSLLFMEKSGWVAHISVWSDAAAYREMSIILISTLRLIVVLYISSFIAGYLNVYVVRNTLQRSKMLNYISKLTVAFNKSIINDSLTNFYTFGYFKLRLVEEMLKARFFETELTLIYFSIKDFDKVEQKQGMFFANRVLKEFAKNLNYLFSKHDLACRVTDGEFIALIVDAKESGVAGKINQLREKIRDVVINIDGNIIDNMEVAFGWVMFPQDAQSVEVLIEKGRQSWYIAKHMDDDSVFRYKGEFEKN
ncbi:MAG: diguanylate cyclase [Armatimonadota bacterium]